MAKCHNCGRVFTERDLKDASEGKESPVGDWDWVCYPCQLSMSKQGWERYKQRMLRLHDGSGKCDHE